MNNWNKMTKRLNLLQKHTYKCKCGHSVVIPPKQIFIICDWCNKIVFKNEKDEFIYKLNLKMKEE